MRRLYKGKFPKKESTLEMAKAIIELQKESRLLREIIKKKLGVTDLEIDTALVINQ